MGLTIYQAFFASLYLTISMYSKDFREEDRKENFQPKSEYDFIVVGAGTAGSVVTSKLCQKYSVLLIEVGGETPPPNYTPAAYQFLDNIDTDSIYTHNWTIKGQKASTSTGGDMIIVQGKGLGGSTMLNAMAYIRGHGFNYDFWAESTGEPSWRYENLRKYFEATEKYIETPNDGMGTNGPLPIILAERTLEGDQFNWVQQWHAAGREMGYEANLNPNPDLKEGFMRVHENKEKGHRFTSFDAFVKPNLGKGNLDVLRYGEVLKVEINRRNMVTGVVYKKDGKVNTVKAKREVILSAGALNSPKILMNSGIGPRAELRRARIPVKIDLPVGQFMQDHIGSIVYTKPLEKEPYNHYDADAHKKEFDEEGTGPMSATFGRFAQAYFRSDFQTSNSSAPDIKFSVLYNSSYVGNGDNRIQINVYVMNPSSSGRVTLNPDDPQKPLIVNPEYLTTERDQIIMGQGVKKAYQLLQTEEFMKTGAVLDPNTPPQCQQFEAGSDEYFRCYGMTYSSSLFHPVGTARMGPRRDKTAVTDPKTLRVWGMKNLRVIDNSIAYSSITAYTNALAYMIGQKGAEAILKGAENQSGDGSNCFVLLGIEYCS